MSRRPVIDTKERVEDLLKELRKGLETSAMEGTSKAFGEALGNAHGCHSIVAALGYYLKDDESIQRSLEIVSIIDEARQHPDPGIRLIADRIWFNAPDPSGAFS